MTVIDDYLETLSADERAALDHIRLLAYQYVPDITETIGYGMPVLQYKGKYLIGFSNFKRHLSVFPGAEAIELMKDKLTAYTCSKGTVQFTIEHQISDELLSEMIQVRVRSIDASAKK